MSRYNPNHENADKVFEAAARFRRRCLLDQGSLLLPGELLWTPDHFRALVDNFVHQPDDGDKNFYEKLHGQLAACDPLDVALMAEVFWIVQLAPTNLRSTTKPKSIQRIWDIKPVDSFPIDSDFLDPASLEGLGSAGPGYNNYLPQEMAFAVQAFADFCSKPLDEREGLLNDPFAFARWLNSTPSGTGRQFYHALCHLLFPDCFERIFSQGHKFRVARAHGIWTRALGEDRPGLDQALAELRKRLEAQHGCPIDYYNPPVSTLLKDQSSVDGVVTQAVDVGEEEVGGKSLVVNCNAAAPDNVIYFGPPGTGKTHAMERRMRKAFEDGDDLEFVAFHPSYSYEEFVGGLRPVSRDGGTTLDFRKGPFIRLCERAHADPTRRFTLFIDEINRANVAKVFGELITLLEPSKRVPAGSAPGGKGIWVTLPGTTDLFGVPDNLDVVATMNSADRSIATLDMALRRRFRFEEFMPKPSEIEPRHVGAVNLAHLLERINDRLEFLIDRDHVIGHAYFIGIMTLDDLRQVIAQRVIPLLQEYFFEDLRKVQLVLTGQDRDSVFVRSRSLSPNALFPGARSIAGSEQRRAFSAGNLNEWSEADFLAIYGGERVDEAFFPGAQRLGAMETTETEAG